MIEIFMILAFVFGFGFLIGALIIPYAIRKRLKDGEQLELIINDIVFKD